MHPFVLAVLLRTGGRDPLVDDAQLHPPDIEGATSHECRSRRTARRYRCGSRRAGRPRERARERRAARRPSARRRSAATRQERAAEMIGDRQRVAVLAIAGLELSLEVGGPDLIRRGPSARGRAGMRPVRPAPVLAQQAVAIEQRVHRAARRPARGRMPRAEDLQSFFAPQPYFSRAATSRASTRCRRFDAGECCGARLRSSEPRVAARPMARDPLVAGRARHAEPFAQLGHRPVPAREIARSAPARSCIRFHPRHPPGVNDVPGLLSTLNYPPTPNLRPLTSDLRPPTSDL